MGIHSFHLATVPPLLAARALVGGARETASVAGLEHVEHLSLMTLGAPAVSLERVQLRRHAVFAQWESEAALDSYLARHAFGRHLAAGWHVRLEFVRRWGAVSGLDRLRPRVGSMEPDEPVVAVTLAHIKLPELRRFFAWGRPVERQVRDSPGATLALAAVRPPRTFSTFSVWRSVQEMREMVEGHGAGAGVGSAAQRHAGAMVERERRDFHSEFTTLRFRPLSEHGSWQGRSGIVPQG
ncbi:hypothetical protein GCM10022415_29660 [Knoellia locipacati]|uniref:Spheroidene monooxygenase n=1 Tax=Knoellia locipacati TaxID=882824 RepID=A0A512T4Q8_9MICO|nr:hypothetical protein [Knoellia locipacati]GEQ15205.1 hypothetical protein KLO01_32520 [Knoellia locipacati]